MRETKRQRVAREVEAAIAAGKYDPDGKLPTERELAADYGVSRDVARAVLDNLAERGLVVATQGSGWYVNKIEPVRYPLYAIDVRAAKAPRDVWDTWVASLGRVGGNELQVISRATAPRGVIDKLGLEPATPVVARRRVRLVDREPWMISTSWWPRWLSEGTDLERPVDMQNPSPLSMAALLGHRQVRSENEVAARMPTPQECAELRTGRGVPVMEVHTTGWDAGGRAIRCAVDVFPAHRFRLVVEHTYPEP